MPRKEKRSRTAPDLKSTSAINSDTRHLRLYRFKELHPRGSRLEQQAFRAECTLRVWQDCHLLRLDRRDLLSPNRKDWKPAKGLLQKRQHASIDRHSPQFNYKPSWSASQTQRMPKATPNHPEGEFHLVAKYPSPTALHPGKATQSTGMSCG
jgi:hypothetical protein